MYAPRVKFVIFFQHTAKEEYSRSDVKRSEVLLARMARILKTNTYAHRHNRAQFMKTFWIYLWYIELGNTY